MRKFSTFFKACRAPLFSGLLFGTTYVPFPPWALLFCYVPLFLWLDEDASSGKKAFLGAWVTQFVLTLIGFHWIAYTSHEFGEFPWSFSVLVLLLFAAFIHLHIPIAAWISYRLNRHFGLQGGPALFVMALVFSLMERVWPTIFPFHLGYTLLWAKWPIYQWADVIGFAGLSTLVLLANAWIARTWQKQDDTTSVFRNVVALGAVLLALTITGSWKGQSWEATDSQVNVLAVQANIGNLEKVYAEKGYAFRESIVQKFIELSRAGLLENPKTDIMIWPETALADSPDRPEFSQARMEMIRNGLGNFNVPILAGAYSKDPSPTGKSQDAVTYNALFLLDSNANPIVPSYRKTHLLIFGEYLPWSEEFPILLQWLPFISNFGRGKGPMTLNWPRPDGTVLPFGAQICYEGLFPFFSRGLADAGAEVLANVTNDSWFGTPFEPRQHMIMTLARAIEVRRPMVRSTNTGITTAILADGEQLQRSISDTAWAGMFEIKYRKNPGETLYTRGGHRDWILILLVLALLLWKGGRRRDRSTVS